ncbi:RNA polymerase II-binding domain-containing protein [Microdochium trichocladiopsis]|uniref:RNA polymerase II-binding domain-containing protein n=1 Tax=Microdochium trichocladiopsis TaxID=1682393 RepID=A0A9P8Y8T1_9PEZI|nr:RNA polymerase II-binding domain-containing protein [Microdochium trichocladiopsis]KAH7032811.1 RNA polymerase II-binding domain-containing protein [Microdochium trichocladiopsis]
MSYNDDAVLAKLSGLAETQDSIVTVAQWIMFHRRHADRTVQLWLQRLKDSPSNKRLNLIYLANEVTQQSKARHKEDFLVAFSPVIAEAVATAYKGAPLEVQTRVKRVVDVWRERNVFEEPIQQAAEARLTEIDKTRGTTKTGLGGNIFGGSGPSVPTELAPLVTPQQNVTKAVNPMKTAVSTADQEFEKLMGPSAAIPSAPVYAARLSALLKTLAQAEGAVEQCVKARRTLVGELQKILETNRTALIAEEDQLETLTKRKDDASNKKSDVERAILAGLPPDESYPSGGFGEQPQPEPEQPEMEALTPPSIEPEGPEDSSIMATLAPEAPIGAVVEAFEGDVSNNSQDGSFQRIVVAGTNGNKKRRLDDDNGFPDLGGEGLDADVVDMLRTDSSGAQ